MDVMPYGTWPSPVSADMLATSAIRLGEPRLDGGSVYWLEGRPTEGGRTVIVRADPGSDPVDAIPQGFNARTRVHEYGGGSYAVDGATLYFSNFSDQRLYRVDGGGAPEPITPETEGTHRYADAVLTHDGSHLICVRERHEGDSVINELVILPEDGEGDALVVAAGRDFYSNPRISPDGTCLAWLSWDLPWMPWDGCVLSVADLSADGSIAHERAVAGADGAESIWQPDWSPSGELWFVSDRTGWWNLYRERDGVVQAIRPMEAEFGWPHWEFAGASFAFLSDGNAVCIYGQDGVQHIAVLDPETAELIDLDLPHTVVDYPYVRAEGDRIVLLAASPTIPEQVISVDFTSRAVDVLRESDRVEIDPEYIAVPSTLEFPTEDGRTAHAYVYLPSNPAVTGPDSERPPLVVMSHGGPTAQSTPAFDIKTQFWTSRGFAVVDVNYGGSTGYGRAYRERLNGTWGVTDTVDCINAARHLIATDQVDGERLLIRGGSAGGYTTLCALTFHHDFAAGASYYGISDLEPFAKPGGTHKFESRYEHTLIGPYPEMAELYRARSPIHFADLITTPMLVLQGADDEVVPPAQAEIMVDALEAKRLPYAYLLFEGEQHGFRNAETIRVAAEAELSFYAQILGFDPAGGIPRLAIHHLPE